MAFITEADLGEVVESQRFFIHLDTPHRSQRCTQHIVIEYQALGANAEQARVHPGCFVDEVGAGQRRRHQRVSPLRTRLKIRHVGVGHAAGGAEGQIKIEAQLGTAAGDQALALATRRSWRRCEDLRRRARRR